MVVLFFVQTDLVRSRCVALHKRLGIFGAAFVVLMVVSGIAVAIHAAARNVREPNANAIPSLMFMGLLFVLMAVFAVFVAAALLLRHRRGFRKRPVLLSLLCILAPARFRISAASFGAFALLKTGGPFGVFTIELLLLYASVARDTLRHRRLHPAFTVGALLIFTPGTVKHSSNPRLRSCKIHLTHSPSITCHHRQKSPSAPVRRPVLPPR